MYVPPPVAEAVPCCHTSATSCLCKFTGPTLGVHYLLLPRRPGRYYGGFMLCRAGAHRAVPQVYSLRGCRDACGPGMQKRADKHSAGVVRTCVLAWHIRYHMLLNTIAAVRFVPAQPVLDGAPKHRFILGVLPSDGSPSSVADCAARTLRLPPSCLFPLRTFCGRWRG